MMMIILMKTGFLGNTTVKLAEIHMGKNTSLLEFYRHFLRLNQLPKNILHLHVKYVIA
jgi:hypothetical protein